MSLHEPLACVSVSRVYNCLHRGLIGHVGLWQVGFTLGNVVGMYLAQNYEVSRHILHSDDVTSRSALLLLLQPDLSFTVYASCCRVDGDANLLSKFWETHSCCG